MSTFNKAKLSGSTDGKQIKVAGTASGSATTIHTATNSTSANVWDEIWIYCYNSDSTARSLVLLWGGTTEPDNQITVSIPPLGGRVLVVDGMILQNSLVVKAYCATANVLIIDGFVNQIT